MAGEIKIYTGNLKYRNIEFVFVFEGRKLKLIPPKNKINEIEKWFMYEIQKGTYTFGKQVYVEGDLEGRINETGQKIIFIHGNPNIGLESSVLLIDVESYIIEKYDRDGIARIGFMSSEIDCIFPTSKALKDFQWEDDGTVCVTTEDFENTTSKTQKFKVNDREVTVYFTIGRTSSTKIGEPLLELHSVIYFEFEKNNDYEFIYKIWNIAKCFIQYLCYRKNISIPSIEISTINSDGKYERFATGHILKEELYNEPQNLSSGRYIKQEHISGSEGKILNDISENKIYMRHIPESFGSGRIINAARFVMITAAFEWTFNKNNPNGVPKKDKTIEAEKKAENSLEELINNSSGKLKGIYKFLKKLIKSNSLQEKIVQVGKEYDSIIGGFGRHLYKINNEELNYSEMGQRLSEQRNNFAHGNLDKDFVGLALLDLMYLEYIIYGMQLKEYGLSDDSIRNAIKGLFKCNTTE